MAGIQPGGKYKLLTTQSSADGLSTIYAGTEVTIREIVDAATKGAGRDDEDSVVVEFDDIGEVLVDGQLTRGTYTRATAFSLDTFPTLFEGV